MAADVVLPTVMDRITIGGVPAVQGTVKLATTGDWINTGLSKITNVQLSYGEASSTELNGEATGGKVELTGEASKLIYFLFIGLH